MIKRKSKEKAGADTSGAEKKPHVEKAPKEKTPREKTPKEAKPKSEAYVMKKNTGLRILRVCLWGMLIFVFIRGVVSIFQRNKADVVDGMIRDFKANYSEFTNRNEELMSFAQNFAKEYLSYENRGEEDYKKRLQGYVAEGFWNGGQQDFKASAEAVYVNAYRMEEYSKNQADVYVRAEVEYKKTVKEGESYTEEISRKPVTLKVPVFYSGGRYVVESLPQFVADSLLLEGFRADSYYGDTAVTEEEAAKLKTSVQNFLKAYLEADESVIFYYLDASADKKEFSGLDGRFLFKSIEDIKCYRNTDGKIVCLVTYKISDAENNTALLQKVNLTLQSSGGKYFVITMDTRTGNLNFS